MIGEYISLNEYFSPIFSLLINNKITYQNPWPEDLEKTYDKMEIKRRYVNKSPENIVPVVKSPTFHFFSVKIVIL